MKLSHTEESFFVVCTMMFFPTIELLVTDFFDAVMKFFCDKLVVGSISKPVPNIPVMTINLLLVVSFTYHFFFCCRAFDSYKL